MGVTVHSLHLQFRWPLCRVWTQNLQTSLQFGCIKNFLLEKKQLHPTKRGNFWPVGCDYLDTGHYGMFRTCEDNFCQRVFYGPNFAQWGVFPVHVIFIRWRNTTKSLSKIWQYLSCLLDDGIAKLWKKLNSHDGFFSYLQDSKANPANPAALFLPCGKDGPPNKNWWLFCSEHLERQIMYQNDGISKRNWLKSLQPAFSI